MERTGFLCPKRNANKYNQPSGFKIEDFCWLLSTLMLKWNEFGKNVLKIHTVDKICTYFTIFGVFLTAVSSNGDQTVVFPSLINQCEQCFCTYLPRVSHDIKPQPFYNMMNGFSLAESMGNWAQVVMTGFQYACVHPAQPRSSQEEHTDNGLTFIMCQRAKKGL